MGYRNIKKIPLISSKKDNAKELSGAINNLVKHSQDGLIALSLNGDVLSVNDVAAQIIQKKPEKMMNRPIWAALKLSNFSTMKQLVKTRRYFLDATYGQAQQFTWVEPSYGKPKIAYDILLYRTEIANTSLIIVKIIDCLEAKTQEWVINSLVNISHREDHEQTTDTLLKLSNDAFHSDFALISLMPEDNKAKTLSMFQRENKKNNISFSFVNSPLEYILQEQELCYLTNIQKQFPNEALFKKLKVQSCLAGPLFNSENEIVGLYAILSRTPFELTSSKKQLFQLILNRINLEIKNSVSEQGLKLLADIPQEDPNPIIRVTLKGDVIYANTQGKKLIKYWTKRYTRIPDRFLEEIKKLHASAQQSRLEYEANNLTYLFSLTLNEELKQVTIHGTDISQLKTTELNIINLAHFDALTKIANRQYFEEIVTEKIYEHDRSNKELAILIIDLDNFKTINDTLGHLIGDKLLKAASQRMARCLRSNDYIARMGGDEFVAFLGYTNVDATKAVAEKIISVLSRMYKFGDSQIKITASVGISMFPDSGRNLNELLKSADIAMYQAKKLGKNSYMIFSQALQTIQEKRNEALRSEIKNAVANNELFIVYQPQIDIISNKIVGVESYLHWEHPKEGLILPGEFIRIAEQTGSIRNISQWLVDNCLRDFVHFLRINPYIKLSINVSLIQLNDNHFLEFLIQHINSYHLKREQIEIDISERSIAPHFKQITQHLKKIHKLGINTCIDNFGSPQVSLPKLLALPIDCLKLDQQLLEGIEKNIKHRMLLKGVIKLAKALDIEVLQKGVETKAQHRIIKTMGCKIAQGYYYCKPIRSTNMEDFLKDYQKS